MIGLDTNVLVRFLVRDDEAQYVRASALLNAPPDDGFFIGDVVLAEVMWVLHRSYGCTREEIATTVQTLLEATGLHFESTDRVHAALRRYARGSAGFSDCLIAERAWDAGCEELVSFDRGLSREPGVRRL